MEGFKDFLNNLVNDHLGVMITAILLFVAIIVCAIFLSLKIKNNKKQREQQEYKEELSKISKEELDNIAGNVSNPEVLYKSFETANAASDNSPSAENKNAAKNADGENGDGVQVAETKSDVTADAKADEATAFAADEATAGSGNESAEPQPPAAEKPATKTAGKKQTKAVAKKAAAVIEIPANTAQAPEAAAQKQTKIVGDNSAAQSKKTATKKPAATKKAAPVDQNTAEAAKPAEQRKQSYAGKWVIVKDEAGKYFAKLLASNGGVLIKTESYSSLSGAKNGIQTIKKNIDGGNFATSIDKYGRYSFKLYSMSNRLIFRSEDYSSKAKCESAINSVKRFAKTETLVREDLSEQND